MSSSKRKVWGRMAPVSNDAAIARALRTDSEALRYAEWWVRQRIYGLEDAELRTLRDEYIQAYRDILGTASQYVGDERARIAQLAAQIEREIDGITSQLMQTHAGQLDAALTNAWRQGHFGRAWLLDNVTVAEWSANFNILVPREAIRAALESPYIGTDGWINLSRETLVSEVKRSVIQGLMQGEGMRDIRRRLADALGIRPGQTSDFKGAYYRALLITRTEVMRASNLGALAIYEQNRDVLSGWEWVATLDERTCPICGQLDGKVFEWDGNGHEIRDRIKVPGQSRRVWGMRRVRSQPPSGSHGGCRCSVAPVLIDAGLLDPELTKPRELYPDWARRVKLFDDGGLATQRASDAHGLNRTAA